MQHRLAIAALLVAALAPSCTQPGGDDAPVADLLLEDREVWTGEGFERRDLAVVDGRISDAAVRGPDTVVLGGEGRFVVPGYADAHQHVVNANPEASDAFLRVGTYYAWNPNSMSSKTSPESRAFFARTDTVDRWHSLGGITEPGSHPEPLYTDFLRQYVYPDMAEEDFRGDAFHYVETEADIAPVLDRLAADGADFVKIYLLVSENYAADGSADTGLDPALVAPIVEAAHARGLPVYAHTESAHDLEVAVKAGVDIAGHLPGYGNLSAKTAESRTVTPELARRVAASGMMVIPTYNIAIDREEMMGPENAALTARVQRDNLRALVDAGAVLLSGSDTSRDTPTREIERWVDIGGLSREAALEAFLQTPSTLMPNSGLGCLEDGCRADFLVLDRDPREDLEALGSISTWVKAGEVLWPFETGNGAE